MADGFLDDAKEWLSYAEADLGVATRLYPPKVNTKMSLSGKNRTKHLP